MFADTSFVIDFMHERRRGQSGPATRTLRAHGAVKLRMPVFVRCELEAGARRSRNPQREVDSVARLTDFMELALPGPDFAPRYGDIEWTLRSRGMMIPTMDLLIGTLCVCAGEPILTSDEHFRRIPTLSVVRFDQA